MSSTPEGKLKRTVKLKEVKKAIRKIRDFYAERKESLKKTPGRGRSGKKEIERQANRLRWSHTKLREARQFARKEQEGGGKKTTVGYSRVQLNELCRLLKTHKPV